MFGSSSAIPKAVEYDKAMIVGDGSPSTLSESTMYELDPTSWQSTLEDDGFELGDTLSDLIYNGFDYEIGVGQEPWCGCLSKWALKYVSEPFDPINYST